MSSAHAIDGWYVVEAIEESVAGQDDRAQGRTGNIYSDWSFTLNQLKAILFRIYLITYYTWTFSCIRQLFCFNLFQCSAYKSGDNDLVIPKLNISIQLS
jgi:hypothetical protein